jgi:hypothetical protein
MEDEAREGKQQRSTHKHEATWLLAIIHDIQLFQYFFMRVSLYQLLLPSPCFSTFGIVCLIQHAFFSPCFTYSKPQTLPLKKESVKTKIPPWHYHCYYIK